VRRVSEEVPWYYKWLILAGADDVKRQSEDLQKYFGKIGGIIPHLGERPKRHVTEVELLWEDEVELPMMIETFKKRQRGVETELIRSVILKEVYQTGTKDRILINQKKLMNV
jgi:hypothetical protein